MYVISLSRLYHLKYKEVNQSSHGLYSGTVSCSLITSIVRLRLTLSTALMYFPLNSAYVARHISLHRTEMKFSLSLGEFLALLFMPVDHSLLLLIVDGAWLSLMSIAITRMVFHLREYMVGPPSVSVYTMATAGPQTSSVVSQAGMAFAPGRGRMFDNIDSQRTVEENMEMNGYSYRSWRFPLCVCTLFFALSTCATSYTLLLLFSRIECLIREEK